MYIDNPDSKKVISWTCFPFLYRSNKNKFWLREASVEYIEIKNERNNFLQLNVLRLLPSETSLKPSCLKEELSLCDCMKTNYEILDRNVRIMYVLTYYISFLQRNSQNSLVHPCNNNLK